MPTLYLSPSTQEYNAYVTEGTEESVMNEIADAMEPYLLSCGIRFTRNDPQKTVSNSIAQSNAGEYDLHLALHSNAAPPANAGRVRGTDVYYSAGSVRGRDAAQIIAGNFKRIYPDPSRVKTVPTTSLAELTRTKAPAVLIEIAYHDNPQDARWITENIRPIARNLVESVTQYFGIPFVEAQDPQEENVRTQGGLLNIRSRPSLSASILTTAANGDPITVLGTYGDWYVVNFNGTIGYASAQYIG